MRFFRILLTVTLLVSISGHSNAAFQEKGSVSDDDGVDWEGSPEGWKIGYIGGFICGVNLASNQGSLPNSFFKNEDYKGALDSIMDGITLFNITVGQLKDGINTLYKDFSNKRIKVIDAIYVVKKQIMGDAPELIDAQIRYLRIQPIPEEVTTKIWNKYSAYYKQKEHLPTYNEIKNGDFSIEDLLKIGMIVSSDDKTHWLFKYGEYK